MEINSINTEPTPHLVHELIKCGICRNEIKRGASIYQEGLTFGVVCEECYKNNSQQDLELMANLFLAYGGYFGKLKQNKFSVYETIKKLMEKFQPGKDLDSLIELNIKMMHQALLYGVTPQELINGLKILLNE
ncbi:MAG: hypothetical protein ACFE9S_04220 [Candidatus Hermodarchaeota archaeon]